MPATDAQLAHLLRRTGVRVVPERLEQLRGKEIEEAVQNVCDFSQNPPLALPPRSGGEWEWGSKVRDQFFDRLATLPNPLEAKLVLFWHGHFATALGKVGSFYLMIDQYKTIHENASGSIEALAQKIALDPAMLLYLDNYTNTKESPNENWARELMELFLLGANRGYTQRDVVESARAWTGYGLRWTEGTGWSYRYDPNRHDTENKTIFGITQAWTGPQLISAMVNGALRRTCAQFLAKKLWSFFAYENPDGGLVDSLASDLEAENMHTLNFLKRMFARPEFYSPQALQGRVRSPIEWGASVIGALGLTSDQLGLGWSTSTAGHEMFNPPNVAGWKVNDVWLSESVLWMMDGTASYAAWRAVGDDQISPASRPALVAALRSGPTEAVSYVANLFGLELSATTRQALENWYSSTKAEVGWVWEGHLPRLMALTTEARLA
jgi:uncharacterized protein (DUF1800 family)